MNESRSQHDDAPRLQMSHDNELRSQHDDAPRSQTSHDNVPRESSDKDKEDNGNYELDSMYESLQPRQKMYQNCMKIP